MRYGICPLSIVPMRAEPADPSELVNQVLYGEIFKVLEVRKKWSRIRLHHDGYEGWVDNKQYQEIDEQAYAFAKAQPHQLTMDPVQYVTKEDASLLPIIMGSQVQHSKLLGHTLERIAQTPKPDKTKIIEVAAFFLNAPYLWGGRTHFGIDCSGFTQMVYRLCGFSIKRDASQQSEQGAPLSFIEESEPGDLAFFDNAEGAIIHVGIMMEDHYIIHAHGAVRIDRIDHSGIYNADRRTHTHKLRVIKKII